MARVIRLLVMLLALWAMGSTVLPADAPRRPNVVLIMTDNHGPWTLGCYGNNVQAMRKYAAEISAIDDGVGAIMATLPKHGLDDNTLGRITRRDGPQVCPTNGWPATNRSRSARATTERCCCWRRPLSYTASRWPAMTATESRSTLSSLQTVPACCRSGVSPDMCQPGRLTCLAARGPARRSIPCITLDALHENVKRDLQKSGKLRGI